MRCLVITGPQQARIDHVPVPAPSEHQVLIRVEGCGICGSNLPVWEGRPWFSYPTPPGKPGHEGWGTVVATGANVRSLAQGDRVAFLSEHAFADYDVADENSCVRIPAELRDLDVPGEALGCVMNIWRRCNIGPGQDVAIIGIGFLGALLTHLASHAGARVIAISRRPYSLDLARRLGAKETLSLEEADETLVERVFQLTQGNGCPRVIEAVGDGRCLNLGASLCAVRGRLVIAGYHQDGRRDVDVQLWNWRGLDVINAHERDPRTYVEGMRAAIDALTTGALPLQELITHRISLTNIDQGLELLRNRPEGFVKGVVVP